MRICIVSTLRPYNEARLYDRQGLLWAERGQWCYIHGNVEELEQQQGLGLGRYPSLM